jgi:hypothetical protein
MGALTLSSAFEGANLSHWTFLVKKTRSVVFSLEHQAMDKVQNPSSPKYVYSTPLSEPFRIDQVTV